MSLFGMNKCKETFSKYTQKPKDNTETHSLNTEQCIFEFRHSGIWIWYGTVVKSCYGCRFQHDEVQTEEFPKDSQMVCNEYDEDLDKDGYQAYTKSQQH